MSMKVYVINLRRRPDRLEKVKEALPKEWIPFTSYTTNWGGIVDGFDIIDDLDLKNFGFTLYPDWKIEGSKNEFYSRHMKKGEIGCCYSHLSVWRRAKRDFDLNPGRTFLGTIVVCLNKIFKKAFHMSSFAKTMCISPKT